VSKFFGKADADKTYWLDQQLKTTDFVNSTNKKKTKKT